MFDKLFQVINFIAFIYEYLIHCIYKCMGLGYEIHVIGNFASNTCLNVMAA